MRLSPTTSLAPNPAHRLDLLLLGVVGILAYANTLDVPFTFDDRLCILRNLALHQFDLFQVWSYTPTRFAAMLSFAFNYSLHGPEVFGFHLVNLILHLGAGFGVWRLTTLLLPTADSRGQRQRRFAALVAGLLFLLHPLQTQAVTYIWQRTTVMATLGFVWTLVCYLHMRIALANGQRSSARRHQIGAVGALMLAVFSKEIAFTLPFALLALELLCLGAEGRPPWPWLLPFGVGLLPTPILVLGYNDQYAGNMAGIAEGYSPISPVAYLMTQFEVLFTYLRLTFIPLRQQVDYDYPIAESVGAIWPELLGVLALLALLVVCVRTRPRLGFALILCALGMAVEAVSFILPDVIFEHRMYLPMTGLALATALLLADLRRHRALINALCLAGLLVLAVLTWQRNEVWRDSIALWTSNLELSPGKARVWTSRALAYRDAKHLDKALADVDRAISLDPNYRLPFVTRGLILGELGRHREAVVDFDRALSIQNADSDIHNARGISLMSLGRASEALVDFDYVLKRHPDWAQTHNYRGVALSALARNDAAVAAFCEALRLDPSYRDVYLNRAIVYVRLDKLELACNDYRKYLETPSDQRQLYLTLARLLDRAGKTQEAEAWLDQAVSRFPTDPKAHFSRAVLHYNSGNWERAIAGFSEALRYEPSGLTQFWRGNAYLELGNSTAAARDYLAAETAGVALPAKARSLAHAATGR